MNLKNLLLVSRCITAAAHARTDSRGAHYRTDFPHSGAPEESAFTSVRLDADTLSVALKAVDFTRVRPGETLVRDDEAA